MTLKIPNLEPKTGAIFNICTKNVFATVFRQKNAQKYEKTIDCAQNERKLNLDNQLKSDSLDLDNRQVPATSRLAERHRRRPSL